MQDNAETLNQLRDLLEQLARQQHDRCPHIAEVCDQIDELAAERQKIEAEIMRKRSQKKSSKGRREQPAASDQTEGKLKDLEGEISALLSDWSTFKEQNSQIKQTVANILKRVPPEAPEAAQLTRLALARGGAITLAEIHDDLILLLELAGNRKRIVSVANAGEGSVNLADPNQTEGDSAQRDTVTMAGRPEGQAMRPRTPSGKHRTHLPMHGPRKLSSVVAGGRNSPGRRGLSG